LNPVAGTILKGAAITLGNYSSSTEVNPTPAISMSSHRAGSLQVTVTSGTTAHWSVAVQSAPSTTGTFSTPFVQHADGTITAFTNMTTTATRSFHIVGLNDNAVKFVTTLKSGAGKATLTFTPAE